MCLAAAAAASPPIQPQPHHPNKHHPRVAKQATEPQFPICPFTGLYPTKPNVTFTRCLAASEWSCCSDCTDRRYALAEVSANGSTIISQVSAGLGETLGGKDISLCGSFVGFKKCQHDLEQIICATGCNPESGRYLTLPKGKVGELRVCNDYANVVYENCKDLQLPGFSTLKTYFPTSERFMTILFGKVGAAFGVINYTVSVIPKEQGTGKCFNGPVTFPDSNICCDPLDVTPQCPMSKLNATMNPSYVPFIGRKLNPLECSADGGNSGGNSSNTPPSSSISNSSSIDGSSSQGSGAWRSMGGAAVWYSAVLTGVSLLLAASM